jgi:hypothetical protein
MRIERDAENWGRDRVRRKRRRTRRRTEKELEEYD